MENSQDQERKGEKPFNKIDNPGGWDPYCFRAKFNKKNGKYVHHALLTGATPVPKNKKGKREVEGWEFHYKGWKDSKNSDSIRHNATITNLFPKERKGKLDYRLLKKMGLTKQ